MKFFNFFSELWETIKKRLDQTAKLTQSEIACNYLLEMILQKEQQVIAMAEVSEQELHDDLFMSVAKNDVKEGPAKDVEHFHGRSFPLILAELKERYLVTLG